MMSSALKLIVVGLTVVNLSLTVPTLIDSSRNQYIGARSSDESLEDRASGKNYIYIPAGAYKVHKQAANWNTARRICEEEGGYLAIINSEAESKVLAWLLKESRPHIGSQNSGLAHVGIHELFGDGDWVTIHGDSVLDMGFNTWQPGEPDDTRSVEHCGSVFISGKLVDVRCTSKLGFICELPHAPNSIPTEKERPVHAKTHFHETRDDYTYIPGIGAYKVHTQATTWYNARRICEEEGGYLAIINSEVEDQAIAELLTDSKPHKDSMDEYYAHIGFHQLYNRSEFVTMHGESLETVGFKIWCPGQPKTNIPKPDHCGLVDGVGHLVTFPCDSFYAFICELR